MATYALVYFLVSIAWLLLFARLAPGLRLINLFSSFGLGMLSAPFAGGFSIWLQGEFISPASQGFAIADLALYFLIVGPVEECGKFLAMFLSSLRAERFQSSIDGLVLAVAAALGFAAIENVLYLFAFGLPGTLPRLFLGNLGHAGYAVFWGYAFSVVLHERAPTSLLVIGLLVASFLHGIYNYLLTFSLPGAILAFLLSGILFVFMGRFLFAERGRSSFKK